MQSSALKLPLPKIPIPQSLGIVENLLAQKCVKGRLEKNCIWAPAALQRTSTRRSQKYLPTLIHRMDGVRRDQYKHAPREFWFAVENSAPHDLNVTAARKGDVKLRGSERFAGIAQFV
jgi:hypothetical protein